MEITLTPSFLIISQDIRKLSLTEALDPAKVVVSVVEGKQTVTYSAEELELRAVYEWLKRRYG